MIALYTSMSNLKESALVNLIVSAALFSNDLILTSAWKGIYPIAVILAVALSGSYSGRALQDQELWGLGFPSTSLPQGMSRSIVIETSKEDYGVPCSGHSSGTL